MSRSFTYDGSTELAGATRLGSFSFSEAAHKGEVGDGGFDFDDPAAAGNLVGLKPFTAAESDSTPARIFTGFIADRGIGRGPFRVDSDRQWQTAAVDLNSYLDDVLLRTDDANRPAETDVARVTWLLGSGALDVDDTFFITTDPVQMDAADYRGRHARDVLDECGEASGKNFFLRDDGSGPFLSYYDSTGSTDPASGSISSVGSEVDNATTFAPAWGDVPALQRDPSRVYSGVEVQYGDGLSAFVENATTLSTFRRRETSVFDSAATTTEGATIIAEQFLAAASSEEDTIECPLILPSDKLGLYLVGQKVDTNFPHLGGPFSYRISRRTVAPAGEDAPSHDHYLVTLILTVPVKITRFAGRGVSAAGGGSLAPGGAGSVFSPPSTCFVDYFNRSVAAPGWGNDWGYVAASDVHAAPSVSGGAGRVDFDTATGPAWTITLSHVLASQTDFHATMRFSFDAVPEYPAAGSVGFDCYEDPGAVARFSVGCVINNDHAGTGQFQISTGTSGTTSVLKDDWAAGQVYSLHIDYRAGVVTASLGALVIHHADGAFTGAVDGLRVGAGYGDPATSTWQVAVDSIVLDNCAPITGQTVATPEFIATSDGVTDTYNTNFAYQPGSLVVLVDGLPWVASGYTETDPTTGEWTFDQVPAADDVIRVTYMAA